MLMEELIVKKHILFLIFILFSIVFFILSWLTYSKGPYSIIFLAIGAFLFVESLDVVFNLKRFRYELFGMDKKKNLKKKPKNTGDGSKTGQKE